jgi:hypothetical protein
VTRIVLLVLSLGLGMGACSSSCRGCGGGGAARPAVDAGEADPRVEVVNAGREPRGRLEVQRWTGFSYRTELESEGSFGIQGQAPTAMPTAIIRVRSEVTRGMADPIVRPRGTGELRLIEERSTLEKLEMQSSAAPPPLVAQFNAGLAMFAGTTTRSLVAEDGAIVEMKTELVGGQKPTPEIAQILDGAWEAQKRFPFRLPAVPVGPGARWRFSDELEFKKVRGIQLAEMQLISIDDQVARIRVRIRHQAPRQQVPHPLNPKDTAMLEHYRGDADGEVTVDRATAVMLDGRLATTATLKMSGRVDGGNQTVIFIAASLVRARGEIVKEDAGIAEAGR